MSIRPIKSLASLARISLNAAARTPISVYRLLVSPVIVGLVGPACRFEPTCSAYAQEAVARFGVWHGGWLAVRRLGRCRPLGGWGYDPVPADDVADAADSGPRDPHQAHELCRHADRRDDKEKSWTTIVC
jgi:uncharacterized protein